jgi:hypothetical protein
VLQLAFLFIGVEAAPGDDINHTRLRHKKKLHLIHFGFLDTFFYYTSKHGNGTVAVILKSDFVI